MRAIVNISLPMTMVKIVETAVKERSYASKSEFFRMLLRLWMEGQLKEELEESRSELKKGNGKLLKSLKTLR